jgi:hypothetical protein
MSGRPSARIKNQNPPEFDWLLNSVRERVEGALDFLKEGARSVEKTWTRPVDGLCTHIITQSAGETLRLFLRRFFGFDVLTCTVNQ